MMTYVLAGIGLALIIGIVATRIIVARRRRTAADKRPVSDTIYPLY
jgi:hypothetical protein